MMGRDDGHSLDISLCRDGCYCMTHTMNNGTCGKCGAIKQKSNSNKNENGQLLPSIGEYFEPINKNNDEGKE